MTIETPNDKAEQLESLLSMLAQCPFNVQDPVHGYIVLPEIVKKFVDARCFQRLRFIKQLGMASHVYPGATHTRFFHSIGTAYLSFKIMKDLVSRQREIAITKREVLCITLAGLLHDLGHPCFSHMFESFMHRMGKTKEGLTDEQRKKYQSWEHEHASLTIARRMWLELLPEVEKAGLRSDDIEVICTLISPPKAALHKAMEEGKLRERWPMIVEHIPIERSWMLEIVSNWRTGIDTDKFDYFRRDAMYLGIHKEFDHRRYFASVRALMDEKNGIMTLSPMEKDRDFLRDDMLELRRGLHQKAYQHKTVQKLDEHMIDILCFLEDAGLKVHGSNGQSLSIAEAALEVDPVAYPQLIDSFIESRLYEVPPPGSPLQAAYDEYDRRIVRRQMYRLIVDAEVHSTRDFSKLSPEEIISKVLEKTREDKNVQEIPDLSKFRCRIAEFHMGMKRQYPMQHVLFHNSKDASIQTFREDKEPPHPLNQKVYIYYDGGPDAHKTAFMQAMVNATFKLFDDDEIFRRLTSASENGHEAASVDRRKRNNPFPAASPRPMKRKLKMQSSCPMADPF